MKELGADKLFVEGAMRCVRCSVCVAGCPSYSVFKTEGDSPRGRVQLMRAAALGTLEPDARFEQHMDNCLGCRACEDICPSGVPFGYLIDNAHAALQHSGHHRGRKLATRLGLAVLANRGAVTVVAWLLRFVQWLRLDRLVRILVAPFSRPTARRIDALPRISGTPFDLRDAPQTSDADMLMFAGCVMAGALGDVQRATIRTLERSGHRVATPPGQRCCGALHQHAGQRDQAKVLARANLDAFAGDAEICVNSAGCALAMKGYAQLLPEDPRAAAFAARVRDLSQLVRAPVVPRARRVAVLDSCHQRNIQRPRRRDGERAHRAWRRGGSTPQRRRVLRRSRAVQRDQSRTRVGATESAPRCGRGQRLRCRRRVESRLLDVHARGAARAQLDGAGRSSGRASGSPRRRLTRAGSTTNGGIVHPSMGRHVGIALFVVAVLGHVAHAAPKAPVPAAPAAPVAQDSKQVRQLAPTLGTETLSLPEGMPNTNVRAVVQDARGFMWFGTQDGLARYDGIKIHVYRTSDKDMSMVSSGYITALTLDANGKMWVGTAENGVNLYDPATDKFTRIAKGKPGLSSEGVTAIKQDAKGRVWFAMSGGGLDRYEPNGTITSFLAKPLDVSITAMDIDKAGNLWLGTAENGVIRWNPDDNSAAAFQPTTGNPTLAPVSAISVASNGHVWIGTDGEGLFELDPVSRKLVPNINDPDDPATLSDNHVATIFEDKKHVVWVGTSNGLDRLVGGRFVQYLHNPDDPSSFPSPGVEAIYQDRGGVMWVGTFADGVAKFDEFRMEFGYHHTRTHSLSFWEDADKAIWVGTYNDGLQKYERGAQRVTSYHTLAHGSTPGQVVDLDAGWITSVRRDHRGTLWIALKGHGLIAFDTKADTFRQYVPNADDPNSLPVDTIFDIWEDGRGMLWLASWGSGLLRFDPQLNKFTAYTTESIGLSSNHLYKLYPDPTDPKILWLGTTKGGVIKFDTSAQTATAFRHKNDDPTSISSDDVTSMYRDGTGSLWLGTFGGGLDRLDLATGKAERFTTTSSKITNDTVFGILPDPEGRLWISTNGGGLLQLDPKTKAFTAYDVSDGLQSNEFGQGSFMASSSGELFFGGPGGFNAFQAKTISRDTYIPPLAITALKIFNQDVTLGRPIWTLPAIQTSYADSFEVDFAALSYAAPSKNRYAYKLEGFDDKFIETERPFATYTKLGGGKYTLRVRASNQDGVWNETGVELKIRVTPPLWRTWPAYGVYLLILAAVAYLIIRVQRQRVLRAERDGRLAAAERDLELTGAVQTGFLPEHNEITTQHMQLVGVYRPADACGGDWWWHETMPDGRHMIMVGDVTGHGPGPAMVTAAVATAFRVLLELGITSMDQALAHLNREVLRVGKGKYHMTMAALELDEASGRWILHSAGAPPILSMSADGKHKVHFCAGAPLGTETGFETGKIEGQLGPSDRMLLYTDGIPEISLPNGNVLGMRRFALQFEVTRPQQLRDAASSIIMQADQVLGAQRQNDDWTFTMIEWN